MISLLEIAERTQKGHKTPEDRWNMDLFRKMEGLGRMYDIPDRPNDSFFNMDDSLADRAFRAAMDFIVQQGVFCTTTGRVIRFSEPEVCEVIEGGPDSLQVGEGSDARLIRKRGVEEKGGMVQCPGHHAPWSEDMAPLVVKGFAQITSAVYIEGFNFAVVDGREVMGLPMEVYASRRQVAWLREGVRKAGRPGMAIAYYPINTRAPNLLAVMDRESGLRPTDGMLLSVLPDVKIEHDYLAAAIACEEYGCFRRNGAVAQYGGFAGGLPGAIIEGIVKPIVGYLVYRAALCTTGVGSIWSTTSDRIAMDASLIWGSSVVNQALFRNTNLIRFGGNEGAGGTRPGTTDHLWSTAAGAICAVMNGCNLYITRTSRTRLNASQTPLEAEWRYEVAEAVGRANLDRAGAVTVLEQIAAKLRGKSAETAVPAEEYYDFVRHRPRPEYKEAYLRVKDDVASLGLLF
jgi:methylamine--corrinoid protein Co-methyltransferase